jgi:hypothetical protein
MTAFPVRAAEMIPEVAVGETYGMVGGLEVDEGGESVEKRKKTLPLRFQCLPGLMVFPFRGFKLFNTTSKGGVFLFKSLNRILRILHFTKPLPEFAGKGYLDHRIPAAMDLYVGVSHFLTHKNYRIQTELQPRCTGFAGKGFHPEVKI